MSNLEILDHVLFVESQHHYFVYRIKSQYVRNNVK